MKKIIVAFALPEEVVNINIPGYEIKPVITNISKPYAAASLARAIVDYKPYAVLNVGSAGTMKYSVGDIVVCRRFFDRDIARQSFNSISPEICLKEEFPIKLQSIIGGKATDGLFTVNTGDDFVTAADHIEGDVIDMEAFADALVCKTFGVPFLSVKYVTDVIGQNSMQIWEERLEKAREDLTAYFGKLDIM